MLCDLLPVQLELRSSASCSVEVTLTTEGGGGVSSLARGVISLAGGCGGVLLLGGTDDAEGAAGSDGASACG